jgi:hypothetical protein
MKNFCYNRGSIIIFLFMLPLFIFTLWVSIKLTQIWFFINGYIIRVYLEDLLYGLIVRFNKLIKWNPNTYRDIEDEQEVEKTIFNFLKQFYVYNFYTLRLSRFNRLKGDKSKYQECKDILREVDYLDEENNQDDYVENNTTTLSDTTQSDIKPYENIKVSAVKTTSIQIFSMKDSLINTPINTVEFETFWRIDSTANFPAYEGRVQIWRFNILINGMALPMSIWFWKFDIIFHKFWEDIVDKLDPLVTISIQLVGHSLGKPHWSIYENANLLKDSIIKDNKGKAGIYRWVNLISGKDLQ